MIPAERIKRLLKRVQEASGGELRSDLMTWNKVQFNLWLDGVNKGIFQKNDASQFGAFGELFFSYVDTYSKYPKSLNDILLFAQRKLY